MRRVLAVTITMLLLGVVPAMAEESNIKRETNWHISTPLLWTPGIGVAFDDDSRGSLMSEYLSIQVSLWSVDDRRLLAGKLGLSVQYSMHGDFLALSVSPVSIRLLDFKSDFFNGFYVSPTYWHTIGRKGQTVGLQFSWVW